MDGPQVMKVEIQMTTIESGSGKRRTSELGYAKPEMVGMPDKMGGRSLFPYICGLYASTYAAR